MFSFSSIKDYHGSLLHGSIQCTDAVQFYLDAINANSHLNAFLEVYAEEALTRAHQLDAERKAGKPLGKLHGVIVGLKDVISYKNHKLSAASKILEDFTAVYNATATERLLQEGAIIIGRQNCDEFAMGSSNENSAYGIVLNATDNTRVPGGSSGGSAVAVQAGLCMISLGSDTGGSVRQPADFCGIVGLKPSYGRISRYGLIAYASSFDQIGIFSQSVEDAALVLEVIAGSDEYDSTVMDEIVPEYSKELTQENKKIKVAYFKQSIENEALDTEIAASINSFIKKLTNNTIEVQAIDFELLDYIVPTYYVLTTAEASSNLSRYDGVRFGHRTPDKNVDLTSFYKQSRSEAFGKEVLKRILLGTFVLSTGYFDAYYTKAQQVRKLLVEKVQSVFQEFDVIIMPTVPTPAFKIGEKTSDPIAMYLADIYTVFANLTGIPAISIPLFKHSNGMPFGLQVHSAAGNEVTLLRFSKLAEQVNKEA